MPSSTAPRRTGATIISRRNPNSRSHTIETAEKIDENRIVMAMSAVPENHMRLVWPRGMTMKAASSGPQA